MSFADGLGTIASSRRGPTGGGRKHSLSRHRRVFVVECAVPRHWAPAGAVPEHGAHGQVVGARWSAWNARNC